MLLPGKELLSEVLEVNICYFAIRQNEVIYTYDDCDDTINIYELAHKCKEWALSKGYQFKVYIQTNGEEEWQVGKCGYGWDLFTCKSLQEACEYIMEQTK